MGGEIMAEYSELIKKFDKIRDYMRDFYVYGFKYRDDFKKKSSRSYDNEKRRIESYLSDYMSFRNDANGKNVFISVDSALISTNPFYRALKAKSFTKNDIILHFFILDILTTTPNCCASEIAEFISQQYLTYFTDMVVLDVSTIRNKLKEYKSLGILTCKIVNKKHCYSISNSNIPTEQMKDALLYFSEISPMGVVGSYLLDRCLEVPDYLSYKHHYIMYALESEIIEALLTAMHEKSMVAIVNLNSRTKQEKESIVIPLKLLMGVQGGRCYLSVYHIRSKIYRNFRLDYIKSIKQLEPCDDFDQHRETLQEILSKTWGTSFYNYKNLERLTMKLHIPLNEQYVIERIEREGRNGTLTKIDETTYLYKLLVYDAQEVLTWVRSFIGRIIQFTCDNKFVEERFNQDLSAMYEIYFEEETDVIS